MPETYCFLETTIHIVETKIFWDCEECALAVSNLFFKADFEISRFKNSHFAKLLIISEHFGENLMPFISETTGNSQRNEVNQVLER